MSGEKPYTNEYRLRRLYWEEGKSIKETAEDCNCAINTIQRWMDKFDIPTRDEAGYAPDENPIYRDKEWLKEKYYDEEMRLAEMADEAGVSQASIIRYMGKYDLDRRHGYKTNYVDYHLNSTGHEMVRSWTQEHGYERIGVHRLIAIAEWGTEAVKDMHVHHKNEIPWDNRVSNLEVLTESEHRSIHAKRMDLHELGAEASRQDS